MIWILGNGISAITMIAIWLSSTAKDQIGGYSKPELINYYILGLFLQWMNGWFPFYWLKDEIKDGGVILSVMLKPISLFKRAFAEEAGWHLISVWFGLLGSLIIFFLYRHVVSIDVVFSRFPLLLLATFLSILMNFSVSMCMGLSAFWFTEVGALEGVFWGSRLILGGQWIPISFILGSVGLIIKALPFRYMFSFPLEIYFGKLTVLEQATGFVIGTIWIFIFIVVYRFMWNRGRRIYTAFGQ